MDFKRWLKEEKGSGGFGALLMVFIVAAAIYAVEVGGSNLLYDPAPTYAEADLIYSDSEYARKNPQDSESIYTRHQKRYPEPERAYSEEPEIPEEEDIAESKKKPIVASKKPTKSKVTAAAKEKPKYKAKSQPTSYSTEDLIKAKLKQGKTVRQIANETGLNRKYIREVKRETQKVIW